MSQEKYNQIQELKKISDRLVGPKRLSLIGQGDFSGKDNPMRGTMNIKHKQQCLTIDYPEFPFIWNGKENLTGEHSSFYTKADKNYTVIKIVKKYEELLKGKSYIALYFLYCKEDDSYMVVERKEVENLTENFGFSYKNDFLDSTEEGDYIKEGSVLTSSTSYDDYGNVSTGVNGRILYAVHPAVQDDAIICSESFAKRMIANTIKSIVIPINDETILLNLYGKHGDYRGLPNIGDWISKDAVVAATRVMKETRMFSDLRDIALSTINNQGDQQFFGEGEIIDINVYSNKPDIPVNQSTRQLVQYYQDARWFYSDVYRICKKIINSGSKKIDREIHRWMRLAMNYLDKQALWAFNDNIFTNMMVEILVRKKEPIKRGRKITGRHGNKTVVCSIWPDKDMPYLTTEKTVDEYGVVHPKGVREIVELITNPLAIINRTIPMTMDEGSASFILDRARKHAATIEDPEEAMEFLFDVMDILNHKETDELKDIYNELDDLEKKYFIRDCISIGEDGRLITNNGLFLRWEAFCPESSFRDPIIKIYEKYPDIFKPYHIFMPKPRWGRDIYIGDDCVGYQYIMMLKQSGEKGFSVRASGAISDESLPEKSHQAKMSRLWHSEKPIRFGEYETPNFLIITNPEDFALITALYRSATDGRKWMGEAIVSEDGEYNIPDNFTSRSAEILQVYLKSLGVRMETIVDEDDFIGEPEHMTDVIGFKVGSSIIFCTPDEMYYMKKMQAVYKKWIKKHPCEIDDVDEVWDYILEHLPFKKKHLTDKIIELFKMNLEAFSKM